MRRKTPLQMTLMMHTVLLLVLISGTASAATYFQGDFADWVPDGAGPTVVSTESEPDSGATIQWGDDDGYGVGQSSITYSPYQIATNLVLSGQPFELGNLTYFNGTITIGTGISSAVLTLLPFSDNAELNSSAGFPEQFFTVTTPNVGTPAQNADYVYFTNFVDDGLANQFLNVYEGSTATADILARLDFLNLPLDASPFASPNADLYSLTILGFTNVQGGGFLTDTPVVPEPSSIVVWSLLGVSFLVRINAARRRRRLTPW